MARKLGAKGKLLGGAVGFTQYFGSALQMTPHLHILVPQGLWTGTDFVELPPPTEQDIDATLRRALKQLSKDLADLELCWPEDGLEAFQAQGAQHRLVLGDAIAPRPKGRRLALVEGFSLHADTHVHANDRAGLMRLCRYGSRGPLAQERLSRRQDGQYEYRTKKGPTLVLSAPELVKRLVALIPPKGTHRTKFHGVFASNAIAQAPRHAAPAPSRARVRAGAQQ
jgi:hypothetical protein